MKLGKAKEAEVFKMLAYKTAAEVGLEFNFDKVYTNKNSLTTAVGSIKAKVKNNPDDYREFGITDEVLDIVRKAAEERNISPGKRREVYQKLDLEMELSPRISAIAGKSFALIDRKLDMVSKSKKLLNNTSFKDLGIIAGIAFDKGRIMRGEATEHIAVMAKIEKNMSPEDALKMVAEMRELNSQKNDISRK